MQVHFERTGERRYGVRLVVPGQAPRVVHPAPGFDPHVPHDLVHYLVEATLGLTGGVYGRAARGGMGHPEPGGATSARDRRRQQRRQRELEARLDRGAADREEMRRAERTALLCDIAWRRRRGHGAPPGVAGPEPTPEERAVVENLVDRLEPIAARWHALRVGEALTFTWPSTEPSERSG